MEKISSSKKTLQFDMIFDKNPNSSSTRRKLLEAAFIKDKDFLEIFEQKSAENSKKNSSVSPNPVKKTITKSFKLIPDAKKPETAQNVKIHSPGVFKRTNSMDLAKVNKKSLSININQSTEKLKIAMIPKKNKEKNLLVEITNKFSVKKINVSLYSGT